jgi:hypothetical protein
MSAGHRVERPVEHAHDVRRLVVDDLAAHPVPQHRHGHSPRERRVGRPVGLAQEGEAVQRISELPAAERPAALVAEGIGERHGDGVLESLDDPHEDRPMRPRAGERDIQVIAAGLDRELGAGFVAHPAPEAALPADEATVVGHLTAELEAARRFHRALLLRS